MSFTNAINENIKQTAKPEMNSMNNQVRMIHFSEKYDALHNLVPFVQLKKREKHPWRSVNFSNASQMHPQILYKILKIRRCSENMKIWSKIPENACERVSFSK